MDYNMEDDIDVIVGDTNVQLELENKMLSDLMASLECVPYQEKNEKTESLTLSDSGFEKTNGVDSYGRDLSRLEESRIPIIIIETEDEWKKRQFNGKQPAGYCDKKTLSGEIIDQNKHYLKQEDREFEIKMAHFQNELSEVIKDDANARGAKFKEDFSSIIEELESQIAKESSYSEERNTNDGKEHFDAVMPSTKRGQCCCVTSGHPISSNNGKCLIMSCNTSVDNEMDSALTSMENSLRDSLISNESQRSELRQVAIGSSHQTFDNHAVRLLDDLLKVESVRQDKVVYYSTEVFNTPSFWETESAILDPLSQNNGISFGMPCKAQGGGFLHELPQLLGCVVEDNKMACHEQVLDNVDVLIESSSGIFSRNDVANQESVDNVPEILEGNFEKRIDLPIIITNTSDEKMETDLAHGERKITAGLDDDKWNMIMSRNHESCEGSNKGDLECAYIFSRANCKENTPEPFAVKDVVDNNENERDDGEDGIESFGIVTMEEPDNLISFEDNEVVVVTSQDVLKPTAIGDMKKDGKEMAKHSEIGCTKNVSTQSNKIQENFHMDIGMGILSEEKKIKMNLQVDGIEFGKTKNELRLEKEKDKSGNDTNFEKYSLQEIGTLVDISPRCEGPENLGVKAAGIIGAIYNFCDDRVLSQTQTCRNMNANELRKSMNTSRVYNAEHEKDSKHNLELSLIENDKTGQSNERVISCEGVTEKSCGSYEYFNRNSGYESHYQSHGIQAMLDEKNIYPKHEANKATETKNEQKFCGSTKRQREQGAELEEGLKKIKFGDLSEQKQEISWDEWKPLNNASDYRREQKIQTRENACEKKEYDHIVVKRECCDRVIQLDIGENKGGENTGDKESNIFPSQEPEAQKNLEEVWVLDCEVGTCNNENGNGASSRSLVVEQEVVPVVLGLKNLERMDNINTDNDNEHAVFDKDGQETLNIDITQQESQVTENSSETRGFGQVSAISRDGVAVVSLEHLNEIAMEEKDAKETLDEKTFIQTLAESIPRYLDDQITQNLNSDEVTQRVTQNTEQKLQRNTEERRWQLKENGTQQDEQRLTQDVKDEKIAHDTEQEEQTWLKNKTIEQKMEEDVTKNAAEDKGEKETHAKGLEGNAKREDQNAKRASDIYQELVKKVLQENDFEGDLNIKQEQGGRTTQIVTHGDHLDGSSVQDLGQVRAPEAEPRITQKITHVKTPIDKDVTQDLSKAVTTQEICVGMEEVYTRNSKPEQESTIETGITQPIEQEIMQQEKKESGEESNIERYVMHSKMEKVLLERKQKVTQGQKIKQVGEVMQVEEPTQLVMEEVMHEYEDGIKDIEIEVLTKGGDNEETVDVEEDNKKQIVNKVETHLEGGTEKDVTEEETDGVEMKPQTGYQRKIEGAPTSGILHGTNVNSMEERGNAFLIEQDGMVNHFSKNEEKLKDLEKEMQHLGITSNSPKNWIESTEANSKTTKPEELRLCESEELELKSSRTQVNDEDEITSFQELEKEELRENRIRSFEMLIHLETIIKEVEIYRCEQNRLRESFKVCMNEIMSNLRSMTKALQLVEARLNQRIRDAQDNIKVCGAGNKEGNKATKISMDALLKSYHMTLTQFGDLRQRVKELEIICSALNVSEMQRAMSNQFSAEIDTMDKRVRFTENDISDLKLRVLELERECSSLRKLAPTSETQLEIQVGKGEVRIDKTATSFYKYNMQLNKTGTECALEGIKENENDDISLVQISPIIGTGQRYCGLHSEEV